MYNYIKAIRRTLMLKINPQYLVDDKGEKTAALLTIKEFQ